MIGQTHGGKGGTSRPTNKKKFDENWDRIYGCAVPNVESQELVKTPTSQSTDSASTVPFKSDRARELEVEVYEDAIAIKVLKASLELSLDLDLYDEDHIFLRQALYYYLSEDEIKEYENEL